MKSKELFILLFFLVISCSAYKEKRRCFKLTENKKVLNINSFDDLISYLKMEDEDLSNILWIVDGEVILSDLIENKINKKQFGIISIDTINQTKLSALYANKNWSYAVLVKTNNCLNKYK